MCLSHKAKDLVTMEQDFKIDLVYLWVDGSDPVWLAKKDAAWEQYNKSEPDENSDDNDIITQTA
jgi:hypothetical protein